jgi:parallel beta-helix repeat protein
MEGVIVNNTIVDNRVSGIALSGFDSGSLVANNIIFGMPALVIESCDGSLPSIEANDIYSPSGEAIAGGTITSLTQIPGNLSTDPWFACEPEGDFHLLAGSPCIDAGTNSAPDLAATDFDGNPRILAGNTNDAPAVDLGAYEFNPLNPPVPCMFINCQTDIVVYATAGENSAVVTFPTPTGTPVATIKCSPPSGSVFYGGTNVVNCTATYGTNSEICTFNVIVVVGPIITQQPKNLQVSAGESFTLSVGVAGTPPLAYQWSYETNLIAGRRARV